MKRVLTGTCLAAAFAVGLSAQTAPPQQTPPTGAAATQESRDSAKNVTVTGCLKAGDSADSFLLSDLKWGSKDKDKGSAVGTSGTAAAPPSMASATTLKLIPGAGTKLTDHVGHQIEVTGSIAEKASSPSAAPADPSARPASAEAALNVRNVKMIAATCSM
jgi:hypothetical protein